MRAVMMGLVFACSGCLISEPEGKPQDWPPTLGGTVQAVIAGDLDANGSTDIVVFTSGSDSQTGMYLLKNAVDLDTGSSSPVKSFTRFVPEAWKAPIAATYAGGAAPRVYAAHSENAITIDVLSNTLESIGSGATTLAPSTTLWTMPISFPGAMVHAAASNGSAIDHLDGTFANPKPVPPKGSSWDGARLSTTYASGNDTIIVVATSTQVLRCVIPTTPGNPFDFMPVRTGPAWVGQVLADVDGDMMPEIVGYDPVAHDVCVVDMAAATIPVTPSCVHLTTTFPGMDVTILAGQNLTMTMTPDILVAQASASQTDYTMIEDITYTKATGALTAAVTKGVPTMGPANGFTVLANGGQGTPFVAISFGLDGTAVCAVGPCAPPP